MIDSPQITELKSESVDEYKDFLSKGLVLDEEHFRITPNDDLLARFPTLDREDNFTLGAFSGKQLIGVVSFERDGRNREKLRHKGILFRMYVAPEFRGQGIAGKLIAAVVEKARAIKGLEQINLTVISQNERAKKLYESFGFVTFGSEINAIKWKGKYFDEDLMVLRLKQS